MRRTFPLNFLMWFSHKIPLPLFHTMMQNSQKWPKKSSQGEGSCQKPFRETSDVSQSSRSALLVPTDCVCFAYARVAFDIFLVGTRAAMCPNDEVASTGSPHQAITGFTYGEKSMQQSCGQLRERLSGTLVLALVLLAHDQPAVSNHVALVRK